MARRKKYSIGKIVVIGVGGLLGLRLVQKLVDKVKDSAPANTSGAESTGQASNSYKGVESTVTVNTRLGKGSRGEMVALLQKTVNGFLPSSYTKLAVDGVFGTKTETALRTFWGVATASVQEIKDRGVTAAITLWGSGSGSGSSGSGSSSGSSSGGGLNAGFQSLWDKLSKTGGF